MKKISLFLICLFIITQADAYKERTRFFQNPAPIAWDPVWGPGYYATGSSFGYTTISAQ